MRGSLVGRVAGLWRHPVKSLQGESLEESEVGDHGLAGDRRYGVRDGLTGRILSAKREPRLLEAAARYAGGALVVELPTGESFAAEDPALDVAITEWLGRPVVVVAASMLRPSGEPFMDAKAVHLVTDASLREMAAHHPDGDWSPRRFRANFVLRVDGLGLVEDGWAGQALLVGSTTLHVVERTVRCPMTSMAQPDLMPDSGILDTTVARNDRRLGVYADVSDPGAVALDDEVRLLDA